MTYTYIQSIISLNISLAYLIHRDCQCIRVYNHIRIHSLCQYTQIRVSMDCLRKSLNLQIGYNNTHIILTLGIASWAWVLTAYHCICCVTLCSHNYARRHARHYIVSITNTTIMYLFRMKELNTMQTKICGFATYSEE